MLAVRVRCWQLPTESPTDRVIWAGARVLFLPSLIKSYPLLQIKSALHYQAQAHNLPASQPRLLFLAIDEIGIDGHCDTAAPARTPVPDAHSRPSTSTTLHIHTSASNAAILRFNRYLAPLPRTNGVLTATREPAEDNVS